MAYSTQNIYVTYCTHSILEPVTEGNWLTQAHTEKNTKTQWWWFKHTDCDDWFYVPPNTNYIISETFFPANLLAKY